MPGSAGLSQQTNSRNGDGTVWGPASWRSGKTQGFSSRPKEEKYYTQTAPDQRDDSVDEDRLYTHEFGSPMLRWKPDVVLCNWIPSARDGDGSVLGTHWSASLAKRQQAQWKTLSQNGRLKNDWGRNAKLTSGSYTCPSTGMSTHAHARMHTLPYSVQALETIRKKGFILLIWIVSLSF